MWFRTDIFTAEIPAFIEQMLSITGAEPWIKRLEWLDRERVDNPYMKEWLHDRFAVELALQRWLPHAESIIKSDAAPDTSTYELMAFATGVASIYQQLSSKAQNRLRGQLLDGLKSETGLLPLQLEVSTITHLVRAGYAVDPHDLEAGGGYDFLASRNGQEVEVECKLISGDIGRKIHKRLHAKLAQALTPTLTQLFQAASTGLLVRVTLPDRLTASLQQHEAIVQSVSNGIVGGGIDTDACSVRLYEFEIASSPFAAGFDARWGSRDVQTFIAQLAGSAGNSNLMTLFSPGERAVVMLLESAQPDAVLKGIRRQLRDAATDQMTGTRPGCVVAALHDMTDEQIFSLGQSDSNVRVGATGLQIMTSDLLQADSRAHVHSVVYKGRGRLNSQGGSSFMGQGHTYVIKNEWHPLADDPLCNLFGSAKVESGLITKLT